MLLKIKNLIKYHTPKLYQVTRNQIFLLYSKIRNRKMIGFDMVVQDLSFAGIHYKLALDNKNGFVDQEIYWKGVYEEEVMEVLREYLSHIMPKQLNNGGTMIFLDIGTNIGQELIFAGAIMAKLGKNKNIKCKAIGFEPIPRLYKQVNTSIKVNNFNTDDYEMVSIINCALGDRNEELTLRTPVINVGGSSLVRNENNTVGDIIEERIIVRNGDELIMDMLNKASIYDNSKLRMIIKIDVEGYEYEVLNGLKNVIHKYNPIIIMEYSPAFYTKSSALGDRSEIGLAVLSILSSMNYKMRIIDVPTYKGKEYTGIEIINWAKGFNLDQANLLLYK